MTDDEAAITIALSIGFLDIVKYYELKVKHKSAKALAITNLIDNSLRVLDLYRINAFPPVKLKFADELLTAVEQLVHNRTGAYYEWRSWEDYNY